MFMSGPGRRSVIYLLEISIRIMSNIVYFVGSVLCSLVGKDAKMITDNFM